MIYLIPFKRSKSMLRSVEKEISKGEVIARRCSSFFYISDKITIGEAAELFIDNSHIDVLGVTDEDLFVKGIVIRNDLFSLIGQKFGRELYLNRNISEVLKEAPLIYYRRNTFSVIEEISSELNSPVNRYYVLVDDKNRFCGITSSRDLVFFLSDMMRREIKMTQSIHSSLVVKAIREESSRFQIFGAVKPAGDIGGDFQYCRCINNERWFFSLCDVSGKGLNAGMIAGAVSGMYAVYDFSKGLSDILKRINSHIYDLFGGEIFLTGIFFEVDELDFKIRLFDMGHSFLYILRDGRLYAPSTSKENMPLGVLPEIEPEEVLIKIKSGDMIIAFSDGLIEQTNISGEPFGQQRVLSFVSRYRNTPPEKIWKLIHSDFESWRMGNSQSDDVSMLIMKIK
jgi:sigma-B regulation protein RsbU (phosphoserine phosphatase)